MTPRRAAVGIIVLAEAMGLAAAGLIGGRGGSVAEAIGVLAAIVALVFLLAGWRRYRAEAAQ